MNLGSRPDDTAWPRLPSGYGTEPDLSTRQGDEQKIALAAFSRLYSTFSAGILAASGRGPADSPASCYVCDASVNGTTGHPR